MRLSPPVKAAAQRLTLPMLVLAAGLMTILGKSDIVLVDKLRMTVSDTLSPVLQMVARPLAAASAVVGAVEDMVTVYRQNEVLRQDNDRLLKWQDVARRLAAENADLRSLVKLVPDQASTAISARVIADSGGAFMRNVLVDAGTRDGVARGQAATTGEGLVGRVSEVGERTARILLLTDLNSHIPVTVERTDEHALLDGDNSDRPRLMFLDPRVPVQPGDRILTSGSGGVFPPGLPVGEVEAIEGGIVRVAPAAELTRLDVLRLVDYGLGGVLPESAVPPARAPRPGKGHAAVEAAR
jgi:rod shape-determining protein MreC